jgi:hypothetical protein
MAANIRQTAENALQAEKIARKSAENAEKSRQAVRQTEEAMRDIAKKIAIIEEIARQTDLLALNAAIEAAQAGSSQAEAMREAVAYFKVDDSLTPGSRTKTVARKTPKAVRRPPPTPPNWPGEKRNGPQEKGALGPAIEMGEAEKDADPADEEFVKY